MVYDSTGKSIYVGDKVVFRGKCYIIEEFLSGEGRDGISGIKFTEEIHVAELPDEWSVDLVDKSY